VVSIGRAVVRSGALLAVGLAALTAANVRSVRRPSQDAPDVTEPVWVLIPARDEADHIEATLDSVLAQSGVPHLCVIVLDDASSDDTAELVARRAARDPRVRLLRSTTEPPEGWLGKPWACARLADEAGAGVLVFVDADVMLYPHAIRASVATLRDGDFGLVAPYPLQVAHGLLERLVQPLVTWAWMATIPLAWAESAQWASMSAANGQLLVFDRAAYDRIGGHRAVAGDVLEDIALMRAVRARGDRAVTVDGSHLAQCRMYEGPGSVVEGYTKSLWAAFGGASGSLAGTGMLLLAHVVPPVALLSARDRRTRAWGALGYAAGVASRALVARRTGEPRLPDSLAHPVSVLAFTALSAESWRRHRSGSTRWKGRPVSPR
jgi:hypothetical protein